MNVRIACILMALCLQPLPALTLGLEEKPVNPASETPGQKYQPTWELLPCELNNAVGCPVCFMEGLVCFKGKWLLYYEGGDHVGCMAACDKPGFEQTLK